MFFFLVLGASGDLEEKKTIKLQLQDTSYRICIPALITPLPSAVFLKPLPRFETLSAALCFKLNQITTYGTENFTSLPYDE